MAYLSCAWTRARLGLFVGDDLIGPERREVERHLILCAKCRFHLRKHEESLSVLRDVAVVGPVLTDETSVWPGLERQIREARHSSPIFWGWARAATALALAATATLASLAVLAPRPRFDLRQDPAGVVVDRRPSAVDPARADPARLVTVVERQAPGGSSAVPAPRESLVSKTAPLPSRSKNKGQAKPKPKPESLVSKPRLKDDSDRSVPSRTEIEAMAESRDTH